ncbi:fatty acyl-AMP ligase [Streptomyces tsukubensis]|uniref:Peptide synthetase n=1 Tax=Streptomyces tsukubensis TaxID=83656 RepID=A0A1V4AGM5_9ACTN|nr:fatty acyl-AMP ligase [Streptomyces tsukubensis]OON82593.1 peptide synthetase [Streptomyces tsukubensis]QFR92243.1 AMP-binding protein [Streptomyces tsukubensis]
MTDSSLLVEPSAVHLLRRHAVERPDRPAVTYVHDHDAEDGARTLGFAALDAEARQVASWLQGQCEPGDRVLLLHPPGLPFVIAFLGCLYAGVVAVPSPMPGQFQYQQRRVTKIARDARVRVALTDTGQLGEVRQWIDAEGLDLAGVASDSPDFGDAARWRDPGAKADDLVLLQYTSGSTGDPKGVMVDHGNLLHNADSLRRSMGLTEDTNFGGWIPLYHDMGLMGQLLPSLFLGSRCVLMSPMAFLKRPHQWLAMIDTYDIGYSAAPNFAYELCVRRLTDAQIARLDLSRWQFAANGSEPIQASTLRDFAERVAPAGFRAESLAPCYGLAEATVFVSGRASRPPRIEPIDPESLEKHVLEAPRPGGPSHALVGCADAPDFDVRIVDPADHRVLPDGATGEIWLRGRSVAAGYWERPEATEETFRARTPDGDGPYLRTGDLGALLDGELYVTGRSKDLLIVHGRNLYPHDIEHELRLQHPPLNTLAGAVFTVPVPQEEVVVLHEIRGRFTEEQLRELATAMRATVYREFGVRTAGLVLLRPGAVRKTTSGKVQRSEMRGLFLEGALEPVYEEIEPGVRQEPAGTRS